MGCAVRLSPAARRDLEGIVRTIAFDDPRRATAFGQMLVNRARALGEFGHLGRVVPEFASPDIHEIIVRAYRAIYRINAEAETVEIIRFWHAARGMPRLDLG